jgi:prefoldin subunit 5
MRTNQPEIDEVNELIRAVDQRIESLALELAELDEFKNAEAYRTLDAQVRDLKDQQRVLNKRWSELTAGCSENK